MTDIEKLKQQELEQLNPEIDEISELESLITEGTNARIPLEIEVPLYKDDKLIMKKYVVTVKPLTSAELNNATRLGLHSELSDVNTEIVKKGLCTKDGEPYPPGLVERLPAGVINKLTEKIGEVSGIQQDKESNVELLKELMGF